MRTQRHFFKVSTEALSYTVDNYVQGRKVLIDQRCIDSKGTESKTSGAIRPK